MPGRQVQQLAARITQQAAVGAIVAMVLCFARGLALRFDKICGIQ